MTLPPETRFSVAVSRAERLDRFLADQLQISRTVAARLIADKRVRIAEVPARPSAEPVRGTEIRVVFPDAPPRLVAPADIPLVIAFEDDEVVVVDKPAGLVVHPAPGHWEGTLAGFRDGVVTLATAPGKTIDFPLDQVEKANLKFEW